MSIRPWLFDMSIKCPYCGTHQLSYSDPVCEKTSNELNKDYFIILKFMELDSRIKELENNEKKDEENGT